MLFVRSCNCSTVLYKRRLDILTFRRILYMYSTNIGTEYFKHGTYSPFFFSSKFSLFHNSNVFGSCISHILYTGCAKIKKYSGAKRLNSIHFKVRDSFNLSL